MSAWSYDEEKEAGTMIKVRSVWSENLESEFIVIRSLIDRYPLVSMDTEFPGVVVRATTSSNNRHRNQTTNDVDAHYHLLKSNVDALNLIQIGLSLSDPSGNLPDDLDLDLSSQSPVSDGAVSISLSADTDDRPRPRPRRLYIWEFNFSDFDVSRHPHDPESVQLLAQQGIDFYRNRVSGIDSAHFAELLMSSGLVCTPDPAVTWVTFHSAYDFGYLVKILTRRPLPDTLPAFLALVALFFGHAVYDVKYLIRFCGSLYGGLDRVARDLGLDRPVGKCHQAGSDSLLTLHVFQKLKHLYFTAAAAAATKPGDGVGDGIHKYAGVLYGLEVL